MVESQFMLSSSSLMQPGIPSNAGPFLVLQRNCIETECLCVLLILYICPFDECMNCYMHLILFLSIDLFKISDFGVWKHALNILIGIMLCITSLFVFMYCGYLATSCL